MGRVYAACLLGIALVGSVITSRLASQTLTGDPHESSAAPLDAFAWNGSASCASSACHGGAGPLGTKGTEFTTWSRVEPHSKAYSVLFNDRSRRIAREWESTTGKDLGVDAWKLDVCLACHAVPSTVRIASADHQSDADPFQAVVDAHGSPRVEDGVGCEACHGGSEKWLGVHMQRDWLDGAISHQVKQEKYGMRDLSDPHLTALMCAECHAGSSKRFVDHDLIAAGHPRLFFDYSAFMAGPGNQGRWHWDWVAREEMAGPSSNRAVNWAYGQIASAINALDFLRSRAEDKNPSAPWPELAEFDCYACHQDLRPLAGAMLEIQRQLPWQQKDAPPPGPIVWGTWNYLMLHRLADILEQADPGRADEIQWTKLAGCLRTIDRLIQDSGGDEAANRDRIAKTAAEAIRILRGWNDCVQHLAENGEWVMPALQTMLRDDADLATISWDAAAQLYLSVGALLSSLAEGADGAAIRQAYQEMAEELGYRNGFDSPKGFDMSRFQQKLESLRAAIAEPATASRH